MITSDTEPVVIVKAKGTTLEINPHLFEALKPEEPKGWKLRFSLNTVTHRSFGIAYRFNLIPEFFISQFYTCIGVSWLFFTIKLQHYVD